ncbi:MAG: GNAT family N-acetyltransferase [Hormoscilla sp.]
MATQQLLIPGYQLRAGYQIEQPRLVKFMQLTYTEMFPGRDFSHLARSVDQHFSEQTPLWWVEVASDQQVGDYLTPVPQPVGCLWMGNAVDQVNAARHAHIFLVYVVPEHRRRGIGSALVLMAEAWARNRGDRQLSLQVFCVNEPAIDLYRKLGYQTLSCSMVKPL